MLELLLPAGNLKKLRTAFYFGADAVYVGGKDFSLRAFADNFTRDELKEGIAYAHSLGKKVYVTANIFAKNSDLKEAGDYFAFLEEAGADAALISDVGLLALCKEKAPNLTIHLSTQANTTNIMAVKFWRNLGVKRVVLARELSLDEIREIHAAVPDMELEAFVHGAMCVSYSGRCLLSSYFSNRSSNRGECVQPCRWGYRLTEGRKDVCVDVEQDGRGTYFMNSRDLRLLSRLPELIEAGITSFKVEGRMKSEFYVATVATAYRRALDEIAQFGEIKNAEKYNNILENISHRAYTEAYLDGENTHTISLDDECLKEKYKYVATVLDVTPAGSGYFVTVEMRNRFKSGDIVTVLSPNDTNGMTFAMGEIVHCEDGSVTNDAKLVQHVYGFNCPLALHKNDILLENHHAAPDNA
ncbi:MAG: U32 family peptidase [Bacteroides sp.]|nr:U32 family peptidase [Bacillota bacterium]MCM1393481.1 U32 family peptidase [[Eubacterium] siraeum]MCM1455285.1 U32 family peptidase [Bacteroides sp.]